MQFVDIELDPGESVVAEAGALMYKDASIEFETVFGDSSCAGSGGGFMDKLLQAGKRVISGEGMFTTLFTHRGGSGKAHAAFAAPYPGTIHAMRLTDYGGPLICQKDSFLCGARGVRLGIFFQRKILTGLFGGEGFIMERLDGDGLVFVHAGGTVISRELAAGERLDVDTGCAVAFTSGIEFDVRAGGGIKSMLFGGEGVFLATLTGPARSGCSRCRSRAWPDACSPRRRSAAAAATKARCSAASACSRRRSGFLSRRGSLAQRAFRSTALFNGGCRQSMVSSSVRSGIDSRVRGHDVGRGTFAGNRFSNPRRRVRPQDGRAATSDLYATGCAPAHAHGRGLRYAGAFSTSTTPDPA